MKIGYSNEDIDMLLSGKREKLGPLWTMVVKMEAYEFKKMNQVVMDSIMKTLPGIHMADFSAFHSNGMLNYVLPQAVEEGYQDAQNVSDWIRVCGHMSNPGMAVNRLPFDKVALIFWIRKENMVENMSPNRDFSDDL